MCDFIVGPLDNNRQNFMNPPSPWWSVPILRAPCYDAGRYRVDQWFIDVPGGCLDLKMPQQSSSSQMTVLSKSLVQARATLEKAYAAKLSIEKARTKPFKPTKYWPKPPSALPTRFKLNYLVPSLDSVLDKVKKSPLRSGVIDCACFRF